jgi:hypothetical protein
MAPDENRIGRGRQILSSRIFSETRAAHDATKGEPGPVAGRERSIPSSEKLPAAAARADDAGGGCVRDARPNASLT